MKAIVSVIGKDKKGIIAAVAGELCGLGVNIEDISQTIMQQYFTMIMMVDIEDATLSFKAISESLSALGERLNVEIRIQHEDIFNGMHKI